MFTIESAKKAALENYETWGDVFVECYGPEEWEREAREYQNRTLRYWLEVQESIFKCIEDIRSA